MSEGSLPNARVLACEAGVSVRERLGDYVGAGARELAAAVERVETAAIVVNTSAAADPAHLERSAQELRDAGAFAAVDANRLVVGTDRPALIRARDRSPDDALLAEMLRAFDADRTRPTRLRLRDRELDFSKHAHVMGILNVTPDSFYDRGRYGGVDAARARATEMVALGATVIDVGGQSYAHWNPQIAETEERERVVPVVEALLRDGIDAAISIDTFKASVAEAALAAGAHLINDCSGLSDDRLPGIVAEYDAGLVVMHLKGRLNVREDDYVYEDAMGEIAMFLRERTERALAAGVAADSIAIDPGLEFGKEPQTDLEILERFGDLRSLGYPILFAASRKSFIGRVFDRPAKELLVPSLATAAAGIAAGATLVRVHDVEETAQLARMLGAIRARSSVEIVRAMPQTPA